MIALTLAGQGENWEQEPYELPLVIVPSPRQAPSSDPASPLSDEADEPGSRVIVIDLA